MRSSLLVSLCFGFASPVLAFDGERSFMPPNDLHKQTSVVGGITEDEFNKVLDRAEEIYGPIIESFGATFSIDRRWSDNTVNASADQPSAKRWRIHMYGGLARRPEVTEDGFAMVVCHEIGHHLGGYPFVEDWAANEGQSDLYATGACAFRLFSDNFALAEKAVSDLPQSMKDKCDVSHPEQDRELCYRAILAGKSLGDLLAALGGNTVQFDTPDQKVVRRTNHAHPAAQCRLDTYIAGALCGSAKWNYEKIPGKDFENRNSKEAEQDAFEHSCAEGVGARPRCWFAALKDSSPADLCPFPNDMICAIMCRLNPSQPWCKEGSFSLELN